MAETVYILGALSSLLCAVLLFRHYLVSRTQLLFWSALCFGGLTATNVLVFIDLVAVPEADLHLLRWGITAVSLGLQVFGLVWESK
jgi:hypothetical protein